MKKIIIIICMVFLGVFAAAAVNWAQRQLEYSKKELGSAHEIRTWWAFQSIDTMKYSRDVAREKLNDPTYDEVIEQHTKAIADIGATHIAVATPYDEEFLPFLKRWVSTARKYNLGVWFRGNWSGWEGWFGYPSITREQHIAKTVEFVKNNGDLFEEGDYFTSCPECENGQRSDPRMFGDLEGYRAFLVREHQELEKMFRAINKNVSTAVYSMNGDVARLVMDRATTNALGGFVTADHYVRDPEQYRTDVEQFAQISGGKVILGEIGAPIPDIHGRMTQIEQAAWILKTFEILQKMPEMYGTNYWVSHGGSTELFEGDRPKRAVDALQYIYRPKLLEARVTDRFGKPLSSVTVTNGIHTVISSNTGHFVLPYPLEGMQLQMTKNGYETVKYTADQIPSDLRLERQYSGAIERVTDSLLHIF